MKKVVRIFIALSIVLGISIGQTSFAFSNTGKVTRITVSTISELIDAVAQANSSGGNMDIQLKKGVYDLSYLYESKGYNCFWIGVPNVTFRGISGNRENVILTGDAMAPGANISTIFIVAGTNFRCENMTLKNVANHAIQIHGEENVDNVVIRNIHFMDTYEQMIKVSADWNPSSSDTYSDNGLVENCLFEYTAGKAPNYYTCGIDGHKCKDWRIIVKAINRKPQMLVKYVNE